MLIIERRCRPDWLYRCESMVKQQHYEVSIPWPIVECLHDKFFMSCRHELKAADRLNIVRYSNDQFEEPIEGVEGIRIVHVDNEGVTLFQPSWAKIEAFTMGNENAERGYVVARGMRGRFRVRCDGATVKEMTTAIEADEYAEALARETGDPTQVKYYTAAYKKLYGQEEAA